MHIRSRIIHIGSRIYISEVGYDIGIRIYISEVGYDIAIQLYILEVRYDIRIQIYILYISEVRYTYYYWTSDIHIRNLKSDESHVRYFDSNGASYVAQSVTVNFREHIILILDHLIVRAVHPVVASPRQLHHNTHDLTLFCNLISHVSSKKH